jgi:ribosomal protein S18 acetylase RimI-like enzyme
VPRYKTAANAGVRIIMYELRKYIDDDSSKINELALLSFEQFKAHYNDWYAFSNALNKFSELSQVAEIIVATNSENTVIGAVAYVPSNVKKADFFPSNTPIIRMLVVKPDFRGQGIGKALSQKCINRAVRDGSKSIALHTSSIMDVALPMYLNMGFIKHSDAPDIFGVKYGVYIKEVA